MLSGFSSGQDDRLLNRLGDYEDAAIVRFPPGKALVQTVDILTPIVNNPYWFGQIAAANSLSDVYAMGGEPYTAMNIVCFPIAKLGRDILKEILSGGMDKIREAGAVMAGGHSVKDDELKYGLSVTGIIDPGAFASNNGLKPGDQLLLTKPIGTGVLSTALKSGVEGRSQVEELIYKWAGRLNKAGARVIEKLGLKGATDVSGFGLGDICWSLPGPRVWRSICGSKKFPLSMRPCALPVWACFPGGAPKTKNSANPCLPFLKGPTRH